MLELPDFVWQDIQRMLDFETSGSGTIEGHHEQAAFRDKIERVWEIIEMELVRQRRRAMAPIKARKKCLQSSP